MATIRHTKETLESVEDSIYNMHLSVISDSPVVSRSASLSHVLRRNGHYLLYRVTSEDSPTESNGDLVPRYPHFEDQLCLKHVKRLVKAHSDGRHERTPFTSVTSDILRSFNRACQLDREGKKNIQILVIDPWKLPAGSYVNCKQLRTCLQLGGGLFRTEYLVWGRIPAASIEARWAWSDIKRSPIASIFPWLQASHFKPIEQLRQQIREAATSHRDDMDDTVVRTIVLWLVDLLDLGSHFPRETIWWTTVAIFGWWKGHVSSQDFEDLGHLAELLGESKLDLVNSELYKRHKWAAGPLLETIHCPKEWWNTVFLTLLQIGSTH